ncbi:MAG: hypothetical protein KTR14_01355 [Vampirovibrio sp.]|nr:hypothetical protein [Vampirovibrio sp.]
MDFDATFIFVLLSFVLFMWLMKGLFFDPIARIKEEREQKLSGDRQNAQQLAQDQLQLAEDYEANLAKARADAQKLIQEKMQAARQSASATTDEARQKATAELEAKMAELDREREEAYQQLTQQRADLVGIIVGKVTGGKMAAVGG